jgi:hypothetical protein
MRPLLDAAERVLRRISDAPATTLERTAVFLLWNDSEWLGQADRQGFAADPSNPDQLH